VGPLQHFRNDRSNQAGCRCRRRICLLKGCERRFDPPHPFSRYCSPECSAAARKWAQQKANRRYRATASGKERRRKQSARYRQRKVPEEPTPSMSGEGYTKALEPRKIRCRRPGCYEQFRPSSRSPLKSFCSLCCRNALRRVIVRERRWSRGFPNHHKYADEFV
jgi:hypothetical protein